MRCMIVCVGSHVFICVGGWVGGWREEDRVE